MPRYDYECKACGHVQEVICKIDYRPDSVSCDKCRNFCDRIIVGTQNIRDEPTWLESAVDAAHGTDIENRRPETRTEHNAYLKKMGYAHLE